MSSSGSRSENDVGSVNATSSSATAGSSSAVVFTSAPKTEASNNGDSCTWYAGGICSHPRSCSDCLNVAIPGQDCAVSPYGECMNSYMLSSSGGYAMSNFTYCSSDDAVCSSCRDSWTSDNAAGVYVAPSAICVGTSGCICIASCEMPDRDDSIVNNWCIPSLDGSQFRLVAGLIAGTVALFVVATVITKRQLAHRQRQDAHDREARNAARAALRETRRPAASAHLPQLSLSGWADMREKLVSSEQSQLAGGSAATKPTLARTSTTPPAALVEEGDGYRPMSPSEHPPRREL
ncbi:hypothetical protein PHYPSEUDO_002057 [Phytophthora pseudosyringae]|uniref:Uncharacterized protein n=1 Tax=Phytophthora pseudosyringae TaxID=221518 RepID=A0A8T1VUF2_9STRA|nr:hypothetical protein PHYPSEUDO_002057 [Phytophthora pseudosyringae]